MLAIPQNKCDFLGRLTTFWLLTISSIKGSTDTQKYDKKFKPSEKVSDLIVKM